MPLRARVLQPPPLSPLPALHRVCEAAHKPTARDAGQCDRVAALAAAREAAEAEVEIARRIAFYVVASAAGEVALAAPNDALDAKRGQAGAARACALRAFDVTTEAGSDARAECDDES